MAPRPEVAVDHGMRGEEPLCVAAGFPAMAGKVPFLMKDVVLLAASIYLLKQDAVRVLRPTTEQAGSPEASTARQSM